MKNTFFLFCTFLLLSSNLFASGFQINEHGAKSMAMSGAFTGLANDATAVYFNPAGLVNLTGTNISAGFTYIHPSSTFRGPSPSIEESKLADKFFNPINFYITQQLDEKIYIGLGVNNPFGLGTEWDYDWVGRYMAIKTEIRTFFFNPVVSYKISDKFSVGAGLVFAYGDVEIVRKNSQAPFAGDALVSLKGDGTGWGFTAGLLYKPIDELSIGLSYRSQVKFTFDGDATTKAVPQLAGLLPSGKISAPLTTPRNITLGVAVFPMEKLTLSADFQYVGWTSYDKLAVEFKDVPDGQTGGNLVSTSTRDFENSYIIRFGAEYNLFEGFDLRGGILFDNNPVKDERLDPTLPDADRLGFNIGLGYNLTDNLTLDLAYMFLRFDERKITNSLESYTDGIAPFNGVYNSDAHLFGINLSYKF